MSGRQSILAQLHGRLASLERDLAAARTGSAAERRQRVRTEAALEEMERERDRLRNRLAELEHELAALQRRHEDLARAFLDLRQGGGQPARPGAGADPGRGRTSAPAVGAPTGRGGAGRPRRPRRLPPAVFEESDEAAEFLIRAAGVHLVVDGYNVALRSWGGDDLPRLRQRLLDVLAELAVRVRCHVTVVFDGAEEGASRPAAGAARRWLRVVFSPAGVEADELIAETVAGLPAHVPVVVVSDDRRVGDEARAGGANVVSVDQLLAVAGRRRDGRHR